LLKILGLTLRNRAGESVILIAFGQERDLTARDWAGFVGEQFAKTLKAINLSTNFIAICHVHYLAYCSFTASAYYLAPNHQHSLGKFHDDTNLFAVANPLAVESLCGYRLQLDYYRNLYRHRLAASVAYLYQDWA